jgi:uncharacterized damage-inducible protein DinB
MVDPIYPIGKFEYVGPYTMEQRRQMARRIALVPERMRTAVRGLDDAQLDTAYRPGGWTVRQVVHHLADAHMHIFLRFKYALARDGAPILGFDENSWAELPDTRVAPVSLSLPVIESVHQRWAWVVDHMSAADFDRTFVHPERGPVTLDRALAIYTWHGEHHVAQIAALRERMGW